MASIPDIPSPIATPPSRIPRLSGNYVGLEEMPFSLKKLILATEKIVVLRESTSKAKIKPGGKGGGRTTGTMWYKGEVVGFTVEDAVREEKIMHVTAIPDTTPPSLTDLLKDEFSEEYYKDPAALPPSTYNLVLGATNSAFISKTHYKGQGLRISSKSDPSGTNIFTEDVNAELGFQNRERDGKELAFDGVMLHHGGNENASSGCIIFGTQRKGEGTVSSSPGEVIALNKYLQDQGIVGKGILDNLVILDLNKIPKDIPQMSGEIIDGTTGRPIPGTEVVMERLVMKSLEQPSGITDIVRPTPISDEERLQEQMEGMGKKEARKHVKNVKKYGLDKANLATSKLNLNETFRGILNKIKGVGSFGN